MNPIMKLVRMMDWQDAHRPFKAEEKAELMERQITNSKTDFVRCLEILIMME